MGVGRWALNVPEPMIALFQPVWLLLLVPLAAAWFIWPLPKRGLQILRAVIFTLAVLALAQLAPLPRHALIAALSRYERVVIAEEAPGPGGVGAEIAALLAEAGYRGRVRRVATPPVPIPAARSLEAAMLPNADTVVQAVLSTI